MNNVTKPKKMSAVERELCHQLWKKRKLLKDLYLKNLLRTNIELIRSLDMANSTLF